MKNIYELGKEYISKEAYNFYPGDNENEDSKTQKRRRKSRKGLENEYKRILKKYHDEKNKTEELKQEIESLAKQANKLADKYDVGYKRMKMLHEKMEEIRTKINKLDDEGSIYLAPEDEPEELDIEEGSVVIESEDD